MKFCNECKSKLFFNSLNLTYFCINSKCYLKNSNIPYETYIKKDLRKAKREMFIQEMFSKIDYKKAKEIIEKYLEEK